DAAQGAQGTEAAVLDRQGETPAQAIGAERLHVEELVRLAPGEQVVDAQALVGQRPGHGAGAGDVAVARALYPVQNAHQPSSSSVATPRLTPISAPAAIS